MHHGRFVLEGTLDELRRQSGRETIVEMFMELTKHAERAQATLAPPAESAATASESAPAAAGGAAP
jgi:ABC-type multidrug transport system ATPase subunit